MPVVTGKEVVKVTTISQKEPTVHILGKTSSYDTGSVKDPERFSPDPDPTYPVVLDPDPDTI
jgi:hypothetical protein